VTFTLDFDTLADADLVIEAVPERLDLKQEVFSTLDKICRPDAILATNTSSLSVTEISVATSRPARAIGDGAEPWASWASPHVHLARLASGGAPSVRTTSRTPADQADWSRRGRTLCSTEMGKRPT
jgi:hypothetical protein